MKSESNFAEILEDLVAEQAAEFTGFQKQDTRNFAYSAGWESALEPFGLSDLIGRTTVFKTISPKYKSNFKRPTYLFNDEQKQAFELIQDWAPGLKDNFTAIELRSNYRLALLKTHPDQGGNSDIFWAVRKSYELLKSLVTSKV